MFKPLNNYVLIKRIDEDNKTAGGIIIPDTAREKPARGEVIAVGDGEFFVEGQEVLVRDKDVHRLELANRADEVDVELAYLDAAFSGPVLLVVWEGEPGGFLFFPFGRIANFRCHYSPQILRMSL